MGQTFFFFLPFFAELTNFYQGKKTQDSVLTNKKDWSLLRQLYQIRTARCKWYILKYRGGRKTKNRILIATQCQNVQRKQQLESTWKLRVSSHLSIYLHIIFIGMTFCTSYLKITIRTYRAIIIAKTPYVA